MKSKLALSVEQMKHLQELGLDTSDASMLFQRGSATRHEWILHVMGDADVSLREKEFTYTLQDILDKLPHYLNPVPFEQTLFAWMIERDTIAYRNVYECIKQFSNTCLIDAAYEMLCWCIENGYIKELKNK
jgi:hypothetical protein